MNENLLEVQNLSVVYKTQFETVQAVNNVSFSLRRGQTMGLVGETGAGKTTTSLAIMRLLPDRTGRVESGKVMFEGRDLLELTNQEMCSLRGEKIAMIFQDPMTSLNPVLRVGEQIYEAVMLHNEDGKTAEQLQQRVDDILRVVGIPPNRKREYPHQFSGGM